MCRPSTTTSTCCMLEFSSSHRKLCGYKGLTTREGLFKMHHRDHNRLASPVFDTMKRCAFQNVLIQRDILFFESGKQLCFNMPEMIYNKWDGRPFLKCSWFQFLSCFSHFYAEDHNRPWTLQMSCINKHTIHLQPLTFLHCVPRFCVCILNFWT